MRICSRCGTPFSGTAWACPACHGEPPFVDGIRSFLAGEDRTSAGYDTSYYEKLAALERESFWFRSRTRLILYALERYVPRLERYLEIGCGTGLVLSAVAERFPRASLAGSDLHRAGLSYAARRAPSSDLYLMDARRMPFSGEFDAIGTFDVLEHMEEDGEALRQMHRALADGGWLIATVPHHPFLWSRTDELAQHVRRYDRAGLRAKAEQAGFTVVRLTAFVSLLFPLMALSRFMRRGSREGDAVVDELRVGPWTNAALERVLDLERLLIRAGVSFPFGGSLLLVARKDPHVHPVQ